MTVLSDARAFRSGAALSVLLLLLAALLGGAPLLVATLAAAMLLSALTRLRISLLAAPFRLLRALDFIGAPPPDALQPLAGLRLAQLLGGALLLAAVLVDRLVATPLGALLVAAVASLQAFLAITGICLACKLYGVVMLFERRRAAARPITTSQIRIASADASDNDLAR